jgi:hypothetical protein
MATKAVAEIDPAALLEKVVVTGDLAQLQPAERVAYYAQVCESIGVNPLTKPFEYIKLNGKLTLYALKACTDQIRAVQGISTEITDKGFVDGIESGLYQVTVKATTAKGRSDTSTGVVTTAGLKGENLANALMKCETKAKRRATLSAAGLGWLDETEVETIPGAVIGEPEPVPDARAVPATDDVPEEQPEEKPEEKPKAKAKRKPLKERIKEAVPGAREVDSETGEPKKPSYVWQDSLVKLLKGEYKDVTSEDIAEVVADTRERRVRQASSSAYVHSTPRHPVRCHSTTTSPKEKSSTAKPLKWRKTDGLPGSTRR